MFVCFVLFFVGIGRKERFFLEIQMTFNVFANVMFSFITCNTFINGVKLVTYRLHRAVSISLGPGRLSPFVELMCLLPGCME